MDRLEVDMSASRRTSRVQNSTTRIRPAFEFAQGPDPGRTQARRSWLRVRQQRRSQLSERHARARRRPLGRSRRALHARREPERHARRRRDVLDRVGAEQTGQRRGGARVAAGCERRIAESRWITEARALGSGNPPARRASRCKPENVPDEELRLMALNSLARADEQRAMPMLEKIVNGTGSPRLKERALYVLAQNGSPEARQVVIRIARGGNPDLQARAVQHLGAFGGAESRQALLDIFKSTDNVTVKRNILRSFMRHGDRATAARGGENASRCPSCEPRPCSSSAPWARRSSCLQLYSTEKTIEVRQAHHPGDVPAAQPRRARFSC